MQSVLQRTSHFSRIFKKKTAFSSQAILGLLVVMLTAVGAGASVYLTGTSQDLRQQATSTVYNSQCMHVMSDPPCSSITGCKWGGGKCYSDGTVLQPCAKPGFTRNTAGTCTKSEQRLRFVVQ